MKAHAEGAVSDSVCRGFRFAGRQAPTLEPPAGKLLRPAYRREDALHQGQRRWRAAWDAQVYVDHVPDRAAARVAFAEDTAIAAAVADRDHQLGVGRAVVGDAQRVLHVLGHRPGDQQHVGICLLYTSPSPRD